MELEANRSFFWVSCRVFCYLFMLSRSFKILRIVDDDSVVHHGQDRWLKHFSVLVFWSGEGDVVALPLTLWSGWVYQWGELTINSACLTISVGDVSVAFLDLDFIVLHEENAAITTCLSVHFPASWDLPFEVDLA